MSLRTRLVLLIGGSLVLIWSVVAMWMLVDIHTEMSTALDQRLVASARMVAGLVKQMKIDAPYTDDKYQPLTIIGRDGLECEVSQVRGQVTVDLAKTKGSPELSGLAPGYETIRHGGRYWRTYVLVDGGYRIATADLLDNRETLSRDITLAVALPFAFALLGSIAVLWWGISKGLHPLERVRRRLASMGPAESGPIEMGPVPAELKPLTDTMNHMLGMVKSMVDRERRFVDDAAHELRTPLTGVKTHLQVLRILSCTHPDREAARQALDSADEGVRRLHYTLEQLLILARLENSECQSGPASSAVGESVRTTIDEISVLPAASSRVVLQFDAQESARVAVPSTMLVIALRNLLENALRYAPGESPIVISVVCDGDSHVVLTVKDEGPGLTEDECLLALQRFWRKPGAATTGSGMGLSIVDAIARRYGGSFELGPGKDDVGLVASLRLPSTDGVEVRSSH
ncbi:two-component sensor histidine kinase [Pandoraea terrae]|uniref:histidine kinase n=1 Tax=Pandoraea terrae TaxID=1537710 RepID=A0A5E4VDE4_9BURK|nr:ATP-binding protein [Pandoraea terrae]VVE09419.1 two-component sensor histidine kinase [Pandoraea terrae]